MSEIINWATATLTVDTIHFESIPHSLNNFRRLSAPRHPPDGQLLVTDSLAIKRLKNNIADPAVSVMIGPPEVVDFEGHSDTGG